MPRRVLITGGSGFVGQWLGRALLARGDAVFAGARRGAPTTGVLSNDERKAICWTSLDLVSDDSVRAAVETSAPDWLVHLAGIASPVEANAAPIHAFEVNALGVLRVLDAIGRSGGKTRVLVVGSAEQYGAHQASEYPLVETAAQQPLTPYAVSKAAQELIALQAFRASGTSVIATRSFNHSGVGHGERYLLPTLVRRARELPREGGVLRIGNGDVRRDYLHVQDVVAAYLALLESGTPGEVYNVSSGVGVPVRQLAERVLVRLGVAAEISSDPALARATDVPLLIGDNRKLRQATGWAPQRTADDIIEDLIHATSR